MLVGVALDLAELVDELVGMLGAAAGHPAVAVLHDPAARRLEPAGDDVRRRVALQARVRHDPDRRRGLDRHQRRHLGAGEERDAVVVEEPCRGSPSFPRSRAGG